MPAPPHSARYLDPEAGDYTLRFELYSDALPSGRTAKVRAIKGPAERALLASMKAEGPAQVDHMVRFYLGVIEQLDGEPASEEQVLDLADEDQRAILMRVRAACFPDTSRVEFRWDCAPPAMPKGLGCRFNGNVGAIDIAEADFIPIPERRPITLSSGRVASWPQNTPRVQKDYLARRRPGKTVEGVDLDALILSRRVQLDGKVATLAALDELTLADKSTIRKALLRWGGVDTRVTATCTSCGAQMKALAEGLPGFFFPETVGE